MLFIVMLAQISVLYQAPPFETAKDFIITQDFKVLAIQNINSVIINPEPSENFNLHYKKSYRAIDAIVYTLKNDTLYLASPIQEASTESYNGYIEIEITMNINNKTIAAQTTDVSLRGNEKITDSVNNLYLNLVESSLRFIAPLNHNYGNYNTHFIINTINSQIYLQNAAIITHMTLDLKKSSLLDMHNFEANTPIIENIELLLDSSSAALLNGQMLQKIIKNNK